ncbi:hypothetical protein SAMN05444161_8890 [Rhizobiales bacterium GAS191]|nr:hypothetical protein SAMN05444161_8890 [Rhizobiales bacterium GAS191]
MAKAPKLTRAQLLQKLQDINQELARSNEREGARLGKLAVDAGLADLALSDREYAAGFGKLKEWLSSGSFRDRSAILVGARKTEAAHAPPRAAGESGKNG